jgi:hypothetical protein
MEKPYAERSLARISFSFLELHLIPNTLPEESYLICYPSKNAISPTHNHGKFHLGVIGGSYILFAYLESPYPSRNTAGRLLTYSEVLIFRTP